MPALRLRDAEIHDAAALAAIHCASWRSAYAGILEQSFLDGPIEADRAELWSGRLTNPEPSQAVLLVEGAAEPIGFICSFGNIDRDWGSLIDNIHVLPSRCGRGCGGFMMRSAATRLASRHPGVGIHLWVFEANEAGRRFYERLGGKIVERDSSRIPAANGASVLRLHWPDPLRLMDSGLSHTVRKEI